MYRERKGRTQKISWSTAQHHRKLPSGPAHVQEGSGARHLGLMDCFRRLDISGLLDLRGPAVFHVIPTHRVIIDWPRAHLNHQELMDLRTITKDAWSQFTSVSKT